MRVQPAPAAPRERADGDRQRVIDYYETAGPDYAAWSPAFHMHFGYWRRGLSPWRLAPMLAQMNEELRRRLEISDDAPAHALDLGCGVGTTARQLAARHPRLTVTGLTICRGQVAQARRMTAAAGLQDRVTTILADYTAIPLPARSADHAWALESSCHADDAGREALVAELARVLRPGGSFVVADGFMKHGRPLPRWLEHVRSRVCAGWAVPRFAALPAFLKLLQAHGLRDLEVEEVFWPLAPSVAHVPATALRFLLAAWRRGEPLHPLRRGNVTAPLYGVLLGLARPHFAYHIIRGRR